LLEILIIADARLIEDGFRLRHKRQGLGTGEAPRTTEEPFVDLDETGGANLIASQLGITRAPVVEFGATLPPTTTIQIPLSQKGGPKPFTVQCPSCPGGTAIPTTPGPSTTTFPGILLNSPYPFALPPKDIPYFGSKWNGPWGLPLGHYQSFRGTGQYIPSYQYYPLSYFGSFMTPSRYGMSGKK